MLTIDSAFGDALGLSFAARKLLGESLSASIHAIEGLCRPGERLEMEVIYDYLRDERGIGETAGVVESARSFGVSDNRSTVKRFGRL